MTAKTVRDRSGHHRRIVFLNFDSDDAAGKLNLYLSCIRETALAGRKNSSTGRAAAGHPVRGVADCPGHGVRVAVSAVAVVRMQRRCLAT